MSDEDFAPPPLPDYDDNGVAEELARLTFHTSNPRIRIDGAFPNFTISLEEDVFKNGEENVGGASSTHPWKVFIVDGKAKLAWGSKMWNGYATDITSSFSNYSSPNGWSDTAVAGESVCFKLTLSSGGSITAQAIDIRDTDTNGFYTTTGTPAYINVLWLPIATMVSSGGSIVVGTQFLRDEALLVGRNVDGYAGYFYK